MSFGFTGTLGGEPHASFTYCALAGIRCLLMMHNNRLDAASLIFPFTALQRIRLVKFLTARQQSCGGFNGRSDKLVDGCYSFWVGASLYLINACDGINLSKYNDFIRICC